MDGQPEQPGSGVWAWLLHKCPDCGGWTAVSDVLSTELGACAAWDTPGERAQLAMSRWEVQAANWHPPFPVELLGGLRASEQSVGLAGCLGFPSSMSKVPVRCSWRDMCISVGLVVRQQPLSALLALCLVMSARIYSSALLTWIKTSSGLSPFGLTNLIISSHAQNSNVHFFFSFFFLHPPHSPNNQIVLL